MTFLSENWKKNSRNCNINGENRIFAFFDFRKREKTRHLFQKVGGVSRGKQIIDSCKRYSTK